MRKILFFFVFFCLFFLYQTPLNAEASGQMPVFQEKFTTGEIIGVTNRELVQVSGSKIIEENFQVKLLEGDEQGRTIDVVRTGIPNSQDNRLNTGDKVVINIRTAESGDTAYSIYEPYRLDKFWYLLFVFIALIVFIGGKKGIGAFIGLIISLVLISQWIVPQLVHGQDPIQTVIIGAAIMLLVTTYIAHGLSLKTTVAVIGTAVTLALTGWISTVLVDALHLFGLGSDDLFALQSTSQGTISTRGLLLGAILIGTLGALNDITTTQSITIFTLVKENPHQKFKDLFKKGMDIGKEHIASLVNTLVLAYTGSSLGIFIFYSLNPAGLPWWVILNNETTMEEIVTTLVGSSALILAVPFTTFLAAFVALRGTGYKRFYNSFSSNPTTLKHKNK